MKQHIVYYANAYLAGLCTLACVSVAVFLPSARVAFWILSVWFALSSIINAVFMKAIK